MPHPKKKQRITVDDDRSLAETALMTAVANHLSVDELANIFGFLGGPKELMPKRRVCKKWTEAVRKTIIPAYERFEVNSVKRYNTMGVMTRAMPNLQHLTISYLDRGHKYSDGEDPNEEEATGTADYTTHDIEIMSNFGKLQSLDISCAPLNGRYPNLLNSFRFLEHLEIYDCPHLKWDLQMLAGMPSLRVLDCFVNSSMTGNISSLRVLKATLEKITLMDCPNVEGNFMDLADFPRLKELDLQYTAVIGDIWDISGNDFSAIEKFALPKGVVGGSDYEFQRVADVPAFMNEIYHLMTQIPCLLLIRNNDWKLAEDSADRYGGDLNFCKPPFEVEPIIVGSQLCSRIGWRWKATHYYYDLDSDDSDFDPHFQQQEVHSCEMNWLESEPDRESNGYEYYIQGLRVIQGQINVYTGYHRPPTEDEYNQLGGGE
jgi:hypothetical protein